MKILMISPEVSPLIKVGGLADVVGALPKELESLGAEVRVVCPFYRKFQGDPAWQELPGVLYVQLGEVHYARLWQRALPGSGVQVYGVQYDHFFDREDVYVDGDGQGYGDNPERAAFLSRAGLDVCDFLSWLPDVIHCHDWTTGLVPVYLNTREAGSALGRTATVFSVHNLAHQGYASRALLDFAGLPESVFREDSLEAFGQVNLMKAGLFHATKLSTVSQRYAEEIQGEAMGCGLDPVLRFRAADLLGIVNGVDASQWNPATDTQIAANYTVDDFTGKAICKRDLQERMGLAVDEHVALFGVVARFYEQKGLDLLADIADGLMDEMHVQLAVLGSGDAALVARFEALAARYPGRIALYLGYDEGLSHAVEAGSDFFVMPSRFEPCGLNQMYSMIYGTPPIVRATGGLADTVVSYVEGSKVGTGFVFEDATAAALYGTMGWACATYYDRPEDYRMLQCNGMLRDCSWLPSAKRYWDLYQWAIDARRGI